MRHAHRSGIAAFVALLLLVGCGAPTEQTAGSPLTQTTPARDSFKGYVFCIAGYKGDTYNHTDDKIAAVGYRVKDAPSRLTLSDPWLELTTVSGKKLLVSSACYYTEDEPNFDVVRWQG